ncbi:alpha/beta hydrolase domain-containing protein [Nitrospirillum sp. BR 11164]|uniref:alpha/beta hydrolase domain-containing protein n=1 Tax=Nitrospirillum sp. BR 11164 TaxID=3104324 RepID=UPI002AFF8F4E|nr:alpha/beta hydrolase domain-containing protein [Nitrospirillum sp. BR 11164]MEA1651332.1 alpha/beta hydrolase domain-containing protein [Nitrospirillum sp. BR 11164]
MRRLIVLMGLLTATPALAAVERVEITERTVLAEGVPFGTVGPYEKIRGTAWIALDPTLPANARITDLGLAPKDDHGHVVFATDFLMLRPANAAGRNGALFYDVNNRGGIAALGQVNGHGPAHNDPTTLADTGNGFFFKRGYTLLWSAWTWDVQPGGPGDKPFILKPPVARERDGKPILGKAAYEFIVDKPAKTAAYVGMKGVPYPFATEGAPDAVLTERDAPDAPRHAIARDAWAFVENPDGGLPVEVRSESGFQIGKIYEVVVPSRDPYVVGVGLAGIRDLLSFFKTQPFAGQQPLDRALIFGISQSGRVIDTMLYNGWNRDEEGRPAFDGAYAQVPGAGKGAFNQRFGMATRHFSPLVEQIYFSDAFPFTTVPSTDPVTKQTASLLDGARAAGPLPKMIFANTSAEYWNRSASLLHITPDGTADAAIDPSARIYMLAGSQHYVGRSHERWPYTACVNTTNHYPVERALVVALDNWVQGKAPPPDSAVPTLADGTLVTADAYKAAFAKVPGLTPPLSPLMPPRLDFGPRYVQGIADTVPPARGQPYPTRVPAPDADGNDRGGIRQVELEVPLGTHTGWNLRAPETGFGAYQTRFDGSFVPFARTEEERAATHDPRPSLAARYASRQDFLAKAQAAIAREVAAGWVLAEEADSLLADQGALYDRIMAHDPSDTGCGYLFPG